MHWIYEYYKCFFQTTSSEDEIVKGKESGFDSFEEVELRLPATVPRKSSDSSSDTENKGFASENYDDEDFSESSGEPHQEPIFATLNHTEEEPEPPNSSYGE
ncbi:hypothetical protein KIN20_005082 [Parelaphostrongylus tenuis]|uniref:Uncharacterized protein n=1 Tax=Parelaphostrongylus tenuis TaxID=148309 RepID=A0AAD5LZJ0_PARTN|nr:hypothetical protein KIN20_005082 [Parelaphostrongylus tenuis]